MGLSGAPLHRVAVRLHYILISPIYVLPRVQPALSGEWTLDPCVSALGKLRCRRELVCHRWLSEGASCNHLVGKRQFTEKPCCSVDPASVRVTKIACSSCWIMNRECIQPSTHFPCKDLSSTACQPEGDSERRGLFRAWSGRTLSMHNESKGPSRIRGDEAQRGGGAPVGDDIARLRYAEARRRAGKLARTAKSLQNDSCPKALPDQPHVSTRPQSMLHIF